MSSITYIKLKIPHDLNTCYYSCKTYLENKHKKGASKWHIKEICRKYPISKASLMRWVKRYDGTKQSLVDDSKRPKSPHPNAHTANEIRNIENLLKRNPNIGLSELYGKLKRHYAYTRHPASLFRFLRKQGIYVKPEVKHEKYVPKHYHTPTIVGEKMQLDVKHVPSSCYVGKETKKFYQYTIIDETSRERFLYAYESFDSYSTVDFVLRAILYFGYIPQCIQTNNGLEFTHKKDKKDKTKHLLDQLCEELNSKHKLIKPRTPRHNGKVERSHRNDQERFYSYLKFFSLKDLNLQMKAYLKRSNNIPSSSLNWHSPLEHRDALINAKHYNKSIIPFFSKNLFNHILSN